LQLLKPEDRDKLIRILEERVGIKIHKVQIIKVDFQKQIAQLKVFYYSNINESITEDAAD
jgi:hypothetical protein